MGTAIMPEPLALEKATTLVSSCLGANLLQGDFAVHMKKWSKHHRSLSIARSRDVCLHILHLLVAHED